jgi:hypothetical protein
VNGGQDASQPREFDNRRIKEQEGRSESTRQPSSDWLEVWRCYRFAVTFFAVASLLIVPQGAFGFAAGGLYGVFQTPRPLSFATAAGVQTFYYGTSIASKADFR